jgi:plasmid stabilization system protein ParE
MRVRWTTDAAEVFESQGEVRLLRILHGAQQWPPG